MTWYELKHAIDMFCFNTSNDEDETCKLYSGHHVLSFGITTEQIPEDSVDGRILKASGWFVEEDIWYAQAER